jgi:hypothetical protein
MKYVKFKSVLVDKSYMSFCGKKKCFMDKRKTTLRQFILPAFCFVFVNSPYLWRIFLPFFAERFEIFTTLSIRKLLIQKRECGSTGRTSHTSWADMCCCHHLLQARIDTDQMIIK